MTRTNLECPVTHEPPTTTIKINMTTHANKMLDNLKYSLGSFHYGFKSCNIPPDIIIPPHFNWISLLISSAAFYRLIYSSILTASFFPTLLQYSYHHCHFYLSINLPISDSLNINSHLYTNPLFIYFYISFSFLSNALSHFPRISSSNSSKFMPSLFLKNLKLNTYEL